MINPEDVENQMEKLKKEGLTLERALKAKGPGNMTGAQLFSEFVDKELDKRPYQGVLSTILTTNRAENKRATRRHKRTPQETPDHKNPPNPSLQKVSRGGIHRRESISSNSIIMKATASITTISIYVIASPSHLVVILEHLVVDLHVYSFIHSSSIHNINTMMFSAFMCE